MTPAPSGQLEVFRPGWHFWMSISLSGFCLLNAAAVVGLTSWASRGEPLLEAWSAMPLASLSMGLLIAFGFFLIGSAIHGRVRPEKLILSEDGLTILTRDRTRFVRWTDVRRFRVELARGSGMTVLGWDHHDDALDGAPRWEGAHWEGNLKRATTLDARLEGGWAMSSQTLCETLERWRLRYGGPAQAVENRESGSRSH